MDLFDELENLAINAAYEEPEENGEMYDPTQGTIRMWKDRFGYTHEEAMAILESTRAAMNQSTSRQERMLSPAQARSAYLVKLEGLIPTAAIVQIAGGLPTVPEPYQGSSDEGNTSFCKVTGQTKMAIENWISAQRGLIFRPFFVPVGMAYKDLSSQSLYPTLGKDTILPHFRPQNPHLLQVATSFGRTHYQYPVWYFFYGTLASVSKLSSLLSLSDNEIPSLRKASITSGKLETWGKGKYLALVDGPETSRVEGSAYLVISKEHEDRLRKYETDAYEVTRCSIDMDDTTVQGCTFRFIGEID